MSITIVNDYFFVPGGDVNKGKTAAAELVDYLANEVDGCQLSLWLESSENPYHHYHITVFDDEDVLDNVRQSRQIEKFVNKLYPEIDHSTFVSPVCEVWLANGKGVKSVG